MDSERYELPELASVEVSEKYKGVKRFFSQKGLMLVAEIVLNFFALCLRGIDLFTSMLWYQRGHSSKSVSHPSTRVGSA